MERGGKLVQSVRRKQCGSKILGDDRCPRRLALLGVSDAIMHVLCEGSGPDSLPETNG